LGGEARWTSLRPEAIRIVSEGGIEATVRSTSFLGASTKILVETAVTALTVSLPAGQAAPQACESIRISWSPSDPHYMEAGA
ncbi:MAG: TOBE domain-containing protein, partial [Allorhizobium sp.]